MHRYRTVAQISLILSILNLIFAAPIAVREIRETRRNGVVVEENVAAMPMIWRKLEAVDLSPRAFPGAMASTGAIASPDAMAPQSAVASPGAMAPPDAMAFPEHGSLSEASISGSLDNPTPPLSLHSSGSPSRYLWSLNDQDEAPHLGPQLHDSASPPPPLAHPLPPPPPPHPLLPDTSSSGTSRPSEISEILPPLQHMGSDLAPTETYSSLHGFTPLYQFSASDGSTPLPEPMSGGPVPSHNPTPDGSMPLPEPISGSPVPFHNPTRDGSMPLPEPILRGPVLLHNPTPEMPPDNAGFKNVMKKVGIVAYTVIVGGTLAAGIWRSHECIRKSHIGNFVQV